PPSPRAQLPIRHFAPRRPRAGSPFPFHHPPSSRLRVRLRRGDAARCLRLCESAHFLARGTRFEEVGNQGPRRGTTPGPPTGHRPDRVQVPENTEPPLRGPAGCLVTISVTGAPRQSHNVAKSRGTFGWRRRESNPGPKVLLGGFYVRSRRLVLGA